MPRERDYQSGLIKRLKRLFPGCYILKNDPNYIAGMLDLTVLYRKHWAVLEVKRNTPTSSDFEPNQEWYIQDLNRMSFAACIYPENEKEVLDALCKAWRVRR